VKLLNLGLLLTAVAATLTAQNISTIAGGGATGAGDGDAANLAFLNKPTGLAMTQTALTWMTPPLPKGSLLIVDQNDQRIRAVTPQGVMTTVAGTGNAGYLDGPAAQAQFNFPFYIRTDAGGNIYLTEFIGRRVRKIDTTGNVTTIAGTGNDGDGPDNVAAISSSFHTPTGIALDASGNTYVADSMAARVRIISPGGIISTFAGTGAQGFSGDGGGVAQATLSNPAGLTYDPATNNLYIADSGNGRIRKVTAAGIISTFMGCTPVVANDANCPTSKAGANGPALKTHLYGPQAISIGPDGVYVIDVISALGASIIWRVDVNGTATNVGAINGTVADLIAVSQTQVYFSEVAFTRTVQVLTGAGPKTYAGGGLLDGSLATSVGIIGPPVPSLAGIVPAGIKTDTAGNVYFSDFGENIVRQIDSSGIVHTVAGNGVLQSTGNGGPAVQASLAGPLGLDFDAAGNMYIAESLTAQVRMVSPTGKITTFAGTGVTGFSGDGAAATSAQLNAPTSVVVDRAGNNVYIVDAGNYRIRKVDASGKISTYAGNSITSGAQLCNSGSSFSCGDNGPATAATLSDPIDAVLDSTGNMYIAERFIAVTNTGAAGGFRVRKINIAGIISTIAGNGNNDTSGEGGAALSASVGDPAGITIDSNTGALYVSDDRNQRILRIDSKVTKVAGAIVGGTPNTGGYSGDGGPALQAAIKRPQGLTFDAGGNLIFWDAGNNRLRKIAGLTTSSGLTLVSVSGNQQSGQVGNILLTNLVVKVLSGVTPMAGVTVNFTVSPVGAATLSASTVATDSTGSASVQVTLGSFASNFTVTAAVNGLPNIVFTETATSQLGAAVEGAGFAVGAALAPGGISSLFGVGMASSTEQAAVIPLPTKLATNTSLNVVTSTATLSAPLYYVSPTQINFQLPYEISGTSVSLVLTTGGVSSTPLAINVADTSPGIFASTTGVAAALHGLTNLSLTSASPAKPGEIIVVYCAGLGAVTPAVLSGTAVAPGGANSTANATVTAMIGGASAAVQFAGLAPGFVGLYQVNMVVPTTVTAGSAVQIVVTANSRTSNTATIPVASQ
jgi:uncharacterized protein (TIGR03437 family)